MAGKRILQRNEMPDEHKWDLTPLTPLFETDKPWETLFADVEKNLKSYHKYKRQP